MNANKIAAIGLIFLLASAGWVVLGKTTELRSTETSSRLGISVEKLWGSPLVQAAPSLTVDIPGSGRARALIPSQTAVKVELNTDYRKKGLIWYPTYQCAFDGNYTIKNGEEVTQKVRVHFPFPQKEGTYDAFSAVINDKPMTSPINVAEGINELVEILPGQTARFHVAYKTRGVGEWRYRMDSVIGRVQNLDLEVRTNFRAVDYPERSLSPAASEPSGSGMVLHWRAEDLITHDDIGVLMPEKINPGPLTSRITFFAPVCLIFFFVLVSAINILYKVNIHPMHYLFVAAGFFAFHLLLAYMAGIVNIHVAFAISSITSVLLVTGYLSAALKGRLPWKIAATAQIFFLVLFSYSFFLKGLTGLTIAIGSVVTLAVLMKLTAHVDWDEVFSRESKKPTPPPLPVIPAKSVPAGEQ